MSTLWTPGGEHIVPRGGRGQGPPGEPPPTAAAPPPNQAGTAGKTVGEEPAPAGITSSQVGPDDPGAEELAPEELERRMAELRDQLAGAPAAAVVANHCYGLFELAALHLSLQPPRLEEARLAIDSLGLLVDGLGSRLGEQASQLSEGLAQLRLAYVQIQAAPTVGAMDHQSGDRGAG
ncbi:MAG: hypothetical protein ACYDH5_02660 [Acidimicrobiales bacterium]